MRFNTALLHGSFSADEQTGATTTPIYSGILARVWRRSTLSWPAPAYRYWDQNG